MKIFLFLLGFIFFFSNLTFATCCSFSKNYWLPHCFSSSSLKDIQQEKYLWNQNTEFNCQNFEISALVEYGENLTGRCNCCKNLGSMPFWSGTNTMTFGTNNGIADIDAYNFGLGNLAVNDDGISGTIRLNPHVRQVGADLMLYYVREKQDPGVYFKIHAPLVAITIKPHFSEKDFVNMSSSNALFQTTERSDPNNPATSTTITYYDWRYPIIEEQNLVSNYFTGATLDRKQLNGDIFRPLRLDKGRIAVTCQTEIRLADLSFCLGYNFLVREAGFLGVAFKVTCPTGNIATADYMLEPIVGRGGAWGIGAEIGGMYRLWQNAFDTDSIDLWMQGEILHLIPARKANMRSFDLKQNGPGSKYLLVQHYEPHYIQQQNNLAYYTVSEQPEILYSAIDITTLPVFSKIAVEGSFAVLFDYHHQEWNISLGLEVWGRSKEHLCIDIESAAERRHPNLNEFAVRGRQHGSYLIDGNNQEFFTYYCEPLATINKSQDPVTLVGVPPFLSTNFAPGFVQPGVVAQITPPTELPEGIADARDPNNRIPAKFEDALDIRGARVASIVTGKFLGQIGYTFKDYTHTPYLATYGSIEVAGKTNNAIDMWAVGIQAGLNF